MDRINQIHLKRSGLDLSIDQVLYLSDMGNIFSACFKLASSQAMILVTSVINPQRTVIKIIQSEPLWDTHIHTQKHQSTNRLNTNQTRGFG